jgi:hypothetical protein
MYKKALSFSLVVLANCVVEKSGPTSSSLILTFPQADGSGLYCRAAEKAAFTDETPG